MFDLGRVHDTDALDHWRTLGVFVGSGNPWVKCLCASGQLLFKRTDRMLVGVLGQVANDPIAGDVQVAARRRLEVLDRSPVAVAGALSGTCLEVLAAFSIAFCLQNLRDTCIPLFQPLATALLRVKKL